MNLRLAILSKNLVQHLKDVFMARHTEYPFGDCIGAEYQAKEIDHQLMNRDRLHSIAEFISLYNNFNVVVDPKSQNQAMLYGDDISIEC